MSLRSGINNMFTTLVHDDDQHVENSKLSTTPPVGHTLSVHTCGQLGAGKYLEHAGQRSAYPQSTTLITRTILNHHQTVLTSRESRREISL
ncbi:unannotated protein [freshwater metagenome]|uniref:Unannotated protein n=1 Tax=freshwater metagenome TaxID=449393 RepID=A0A6J6C584_9ZZZZ